MKLYYAPRTRATRARWLLEELGVPYELVRLDVARGENRSPAFLSVSPLGELPALVDGDLTLREPVAIALHLADRFPEKRFAPPAASPDRAAYYEWLLFAESTFAPVVQKLAGAPAQDVAASKPRIAEMLEVVGARVANRDFLVGDSFTAADLSMASLLHLASHLKLLDAHPRIGAYTLLHCSRPAIRRAVS